MNGLFNFPSLESLMSNPAVDQESMPGYIDQALGLLAPAGLSTKVAQSIGQNTAGPWAKKLLDMGMELDPKTLAFLQRTANPQSVPTNTFTRPMMPEQAMKVRELGGLMGSSDAATRKMAENAINSQMGGIGSFQSLFSKLKPSPQASTNTVPTMPEIVPDFTVKTIRKALAAAKKLRK